MRPKLRQSSEREMNVRQFGELTNTLIRHNMLRVSTKLCLG